MSIYDNTFFVLVHGRRSSRDLDVLLVNHSTRKRSEENIWMSIEMQGWVYFSENTKNNFKTVSEEAHGQVGNNRGEPRKVDKVHTIKTFIMKETLIKRFHGKTMIYFKCLL